MKYYILLFLFTSIVSQSMAQDKNLPKLPHHNNDSFVVIAHRGASAYAPENTMSAFKLAVEMQAEMIELDITFSKNGVPIVIHDETLDRTTEASGLVKDFTSHELKDFEAGEWFSDQFDGEPIPTLKEVLEYAKDKIAVNIEIKTESVTDYPEAGIVDVTVRTVKELGMEDQVIISSFDYRVMKHLEVLAPEIPKAILYEKSQSGDKLPSELVKEYNVDAFNCSHRELSEEWIKDLNEQQIPFYIYTVNDESKMKEIISKGASGIFSDKPDLLRKLVENL